MTLRLNDKEAELLNKKSQMVGVSKEAIFADAAFGSEAKGKTNSRFL